ncbi:hypothetical protein EV426DRAFT_579097 [Tirmania nivea]|nr:hypothetical protein EV426DRAFT_579097 [Tirmania nivea]
MSRKNKERWVIVEDLKWVLEQDDLLPNLPLDKRKYHPKYNALIVSVGQRIGGENIVSMKLPLTITTTTKKISKGRASKDEGYQTSKKYDSEILDLLDNLTPEKYAKLEPKVVEDLTVADKI